MTIHISLETHEKLNKFLKKAEEAKENNEFDLVKFIEKYKEDNNDE